MIKSATARKCYAYKMQNHEAARDEIKAGVLQVDKLLVESYRAPLILSLYNYFIIVVSTI